MAVISEKTKLIYFPVPKIACTSIKSLFFQIEFGITVDKIKEVRPKFKVHNKYKAIPFSESSTQLKPEFQTLAVVRDPIQRFLSGFNEKILVKNLLKKKFSHACEQLNLNKQPELEEFIDQLDIYRKIPLIKQHFFPQTHFLGKDLNFFDFVFTTKNLTELEALISSRVNKECRLDRKNSHTHRVSFSNLSKKSKTKLELILKDDINFIKNINR